MPHSTNPDDGVRIYYEVEGSGPPLVLVHGFASNHLHWRTSGLVEALRDAYTLIAVDARGNGLSEKPYEPAAYVIQNRVADIVSVIDALGYSRVSFCGFSNGAEDGFGVASLAPERLRSLIAISGRATGIPPERRGEYLEASKRLREMTQEEFVATRPPDQYEAASLNDPQALSAIQLAKSQGIFMEDISPSLQDLSVSCLIMAGTEEHDYAIIRDGAARIPSATFVGIDGLDHMQMYTRNDLTLPYITGFLEQVERSRGE